MHYNGFMDLKEVLDFFAKTYKNLAICFVLGLFSGVATFALLPTKYISSGTLFVGRKVTKETEFYAYSGYYDQQTALSFTNTVRGFLEDKNLHAEVLKELDLNVTERNLRSLRRKIRVKNAGPQLINVEVRANSVEESERIWEVLTGITTKTIEDLNQKADSQLFVEATNSKIWTRDLTQNPFIFGAIGGLVFLGAGTFFLALKTYFYKNLPQKEEK